MGRMPQVLADGYTDEELAAIKRKPRQCRGACKRMLTYGDFELTDMRGYMVRRFACRTCMKAYYDAAKNPAVTRTRIAEMLIECGPLPESEIAKRLGLMTQFTARKFLRHKWFERSGGRVSVTSEANRLIRKNEI